MPQPRIAVALATWNGMQWLPDQLATILGQHGVDVRVIASDDASTDGTREWLENHPDPRVSVLPATAPSGSAARNFYRLIRDIQLEPGEYLALSDQDDVWLPTKLARAAQVLESTRAAGFSSDVMAFYPDGRESLVFKSSPQRRLDYLFETPGSGNTFVLTAAVKDLVAGVLAEHPEAWDAEAHDWLIYALARAHGLAWVIDDQPLLRYRQHGGNAVGANSGLAAAASRLRRIRSGWHRGQALLLAQLGRSVASPATAPDLDELVRLLGSRDVASRRELLQQGAELRRRPRERWALTTLIRLGMW